MLVIHVLEHDVFGDPSYFRFAKVSNEKLEL